MSDRTGKNKEIAVIAGAGPAGLTAALELLRHSNITPVVFECDLQVGGISKTINYRGNRMDLGGHRFFSKSDWVMHWWQEVLPVAPCEPSKTGSLRISYQNKTHDFVARKSSETALDAVMLVRQRLSRIFYRRQFFNYPLTLDFATLRNLGLLETMRVGLSYARSLFGHLSPELSLEDFLINRFGRRLYLTFFKDYTEKVWGVPCHQISAEWGAQRIKGLSITKAISHALARLGGKPLNNKYHTETSLIEQFLYPKFGPGQMWDEVAARIKNLGGEIHLGKKVIGVEAAGRDIRSVDVMDLDSKTITQVQCDHFISTMPVQELITYLKPEDPELVRISTGLPYRAFITVGLLVTRMKDDTTLSDNWIYVQDPDVRIGRLQIFNNWSSSLVMDPDTIWLGLEYFCDENDAMWKMKDEKFLEFAASELERIGLIDRKDVLDGTIVRLSKAYPAYFGTYNQFDQLRAFLDEFPNLYPIGRNGMHRYNNQDHSMLTAKAAVEAILSRSEKTEIWKVNCDDSYHEETIKTSDSKIALTSL